MGSGNEAADTRGAGLHLQVVPQQAWLRKLIFVIVAVPTSKHMDYQVKKVLPYTFQRYILRRDVELEPLYKFQSSY